MSQLVIDKVYHGNGEDDNTPLKSILGMEVYSYTGDAEYIPILNEKRRLVRQKEIRRDETAFCSIMSLYRLASKYCSFYISCGNGSVDPVKVEEGGLFVKGINLCNYEGVRHELIPQTLYDFAKTQKELYLNPERGKEVVNRRVASSNNRVYTMDDIKGFSKTDWKKMCTMEGYRGKEGFYPYIEFLLDWECAKLGRYNPTSSKSNLFLKLLNDGADITKSYIVVRQYLNRIDPSKASMVKSLYGIREEEIPGKNMRSASYRKWLQGLEGKRGDLFDKLF